MLFRLTPCHSIRFISAALARGPRQDVCQVVWTLCCTVSASFMCKLPVDSVKKRKLYGCISVKLFLLDLTITL